MCQHSWHQHSWYATTNTHTNHTHTKTKIFVTTVLPLTWYGCEALSHMLKEVHSLKGDWTRRSWGRYLDIRQSDRGNMYNEKLHDFYWSTYTGGFKCGMVNWMGHVACRWGDRCWENLKGRDHFKDLDMDDKQQNWCQDTGLGAEEWSDASLGQMAGCYEHFNEPWVYTESCESL